MFNLQSWLNKKSGPQTEKGKKIAAKYGPQQSTLPNWTMGHNVGLNITGNGYMPGYTTPVNWFVHTPDEIIEYTPPMRTPEPTAEQMMQDFLNGIITPYTPGNMPVYSAANMPQVGHVNGTGPTETVWHLAPYEASQLYVEDAHMIELLWDGLHGGSGSPSLTALLFTPGMDDPFSRFMGPGPQYEYHFGARKHSDGSLWYPGTYGHRAPGSYTTGIDPEFMNVLPPKKKKKKKANFFNPTGQ